MAHFIEAYDFRPSPSFSDKYINEKNRVVSTNKRLKELLGTDECFIQVIGEYLYNSAKQFAFTRINRIAHGALNPSNVSIDGKWLDLTNSTTVPDGADYKGGHADPSFLIEKDIPISIASELIKAYSDSNRIKLSYKPLVQYYYEVYDSYSLKYISTIFGLPGLDKDITCKVLQNHLQVLLEEYEKRLKINAKKTNMATANLLNKGPVGAYIEEAFKFLFLSQEGKTNIESALNHLFKLQYSAWPDNTISYNSFLIFMAIRALKKYHYAPYFYSGNIYNSALNYADSSENVIGEYINSFEYFSDWIFDVNSDLLNTSIINTDQIKINFNAQSNEFNSEVFGITKSHKTIDNLLTYVQNSIDGCIVVHGFDYKVPLVYILKLLSVMKYKDIK